MSIPSEVRTAIQNVYAEYKVPADRIVADPAMAKEFASLVNQKLPAPLKLDVEGCNRTMLNIRRKGEDNDGLPRLFGGHGRRPRK